MLTFVVFLQFGIFVGKWHCSVLSDACHANYLLSCVIEQFMFMFRLVYDRIVKQVVEQSLLLEILQCHSYC